jgi:hypothetical protein
MLKVRSQGCSVPVEASDDPPSVGDPRVRVCVRAGESSDPLTDPKVKPSFLTSSRSGLRSLHPSSLLRGVVTLISLIVLFTSFLPQWTGDSALPTELVYFHSTVQRAYIPSGSPLE